MMRRLQGITGRLTGRGQDQLAPRPGPPPAMLPPPATLPPPGASMQPGPGTGTPAPPMGRALTATIPHTTVDARSGVATVTIDAAIATDASLKRIGQDLEKNSISSIRLTGRSWTVEKLACLLSPMRSTLAALEVDPGRLDSFPPGPFPKLARLVLAGTPARPSFFSALVGNTQLLREVDLTHAMGASLSDIAPLARLRHLESLALTETAAIPRSRATWTELKVLRLHRITTLSNRSAMDEAIYGGSRTNLTVAGLPAVIEAWNTAKWDGASFLDVADSCRRSPNLKKAFADTLGNRLGLAFDLENVEVKGELVKFESGVALLVHRTFSRFAEALLTDECQSTTVHLNGIGPGANGTSPSNRIATALRKVAERSWVNADHEKTAADFQSGQPVVLATGWWKHSTIVVFFKDYMALGNRGQFSDEKLPGLTVYRMGGRAGVTAALVRNLSNAYAPDEREDRVRWLGTNEGATPGLATELDAQEICKVMLQPQKNGSCPWASAEAGLVAAVLAAALEAAFPGLPPGKLTAEDLKTVHQWCTANAQRVRDLSCEINSEIRLAVLEDTFAAACKADLDPDILRTYVDGVEKSQLWAPPAHKRRMRELMAGLPLAVSPYYHGTLDRADATRRITLGSVDGQGGLVRFSKRRNKFYFSHTTAANTVRHLEIPDHLVTIGELDQWLASVRKECDNADLVRRPVDVVSGT